MAQQLTSYSTAIQRSLYAIDIADGLRSTVYGFVTQCGAIFTVCDLNDVPVGFVRDAEMSFEATDSLRLALTGCIEGCRSPDWCDHPVTQNLLAVAEQIAVDFTQHLINFTQRRLP